MKYRGGKALVTGASSGIGAAFARALAARGMDLLLTALPEESARLCELAEELRCTHEVRTEDVPIDLAEPDAASRLQVAADDLNFDPNLLINSAGIGAGGAFAEASLERQLRMITVNIEVLVALTGLYLPRMIARHDGGIVNVVSTAAFQPIPYFAVYAASKAFALRFSEALWAENHRQGVRVVALCPGPVNTPFHTPFHGKAGDTGPEYGVQGQMKRRYLAPESVVENALNALEHDRPTVVQRLPGFGLLYAPLTAVVNLFPRRLGLLGSERLFHWLYRQP